MKLVPAARARREILGGITTMTLWRWQQRPELGLPRPVQIGNRRFYPEDELRAWVESRRLPALDAEVSADA